MLFSNASYSFVNSLSISIRVKQPLKLSMAINVILYNLLTTGLFGNIFASLLANTPDPLASCCVRHSNILPPHIDKNECRNVKTIHKIGKEFEQAGEERFNWTWRHKKMSTISEGRSSQARDNIHCDLNVRLKEPRKICIFWLKYICIMFLKTCNRITCIFNL